MIILYWHLPYDQFTVVIYIVLALWEVGRTTTTEILTLFRHKRFIKATPMRYSLQSITANMYYKHCILILFSAKHVMVPTAHHSQCRNSNFQEMESDTITVKKTRYVTSIITNSEMLLIIHNTRCSFLPGRIEMCKYLYLQLVKKNEHTAAMCTVTYRNCSCMLITMLR